MPRPLSEKEKQEWKERVRLHSDSGQSLQQWCREHQVNYDSMIYWRRKMGASAAKAIERSSFRELPSPLADQRITIEYQKVQIHLPPNLDPVILTKYLRGLKESS
jgi:transposase-like protein